MLRWLCLSILCCYSAFAQDKFEVLAVEYPPFTTSKAADDGLAFLVLRQAFPAYKFKPLIVPPKRAYNMIQNGQWCMSFYPSSEGVAADKVVLSEHAIKIGLVRLRQQEPFTWTDLDELVGLHVALLRSGEDSPFTSKFYQAGLVVTFTETIQQSMDLVMRQRVDIAMYDDYNFNQLPAALREKLQFSDSVLLQTPITLFTNPHCNNLLPREIQLRLVPQVNDKAAAAH